VLKPFGVAKCLRNVGSVESKFLAKSKRVEPLIVNKSSKEADNKPPLITESL
jgi:hypothetical protein